MSGKRAYLDLDLDLDLDFDLDLVLPHVAAVNFRKLEVYRYAIQFLPLAAEIGQIDQAQAGRADEILLPIVRMLSKMAQG